MPLVIMGVHRGEKLGDEIRHLGHIYRVTKIRARTVTFDIVAAVTRGRDRVIMEAESKAVAAMIEIHQPPAGPMTRARTARLPKSSDTSRPTVASGDIINLLGVESVSASA